MLINTCITNPLVLHHRCRHHAIAKFFGDSVPNVSMFILVHYKAVLLYSYEVFTTYITVLNVIQGPITR